MKKRSISIALLSTLIFTGCTSFWTTASTWKKIAVVSITGNRTLSKCENATAAESKNPAVVIRAIADIAGDEKEFQYDSVFARCVDFTHEIMKNPHQIPFMNPSDVVNNPFYQESAYKSDAPKMATSLGNKLISYSSQSYENSVFTARGYKVLNPTIDPMIFQDSLKVDALALLQTDFKYELEGFGTCGSARGVADVTVSIMYKNEKNQRRGYSMTFRGISSKTCDVKIVAKFKGSEMEPLLYEAYQKAIISFMADYDSKIAMAKQNRAL